MIMVYACHVVYDIRSNRCSDLTCLLLFARDLIMILLGIS